MLKLSLEKISEIENLEQFETIDIDEKTRVMKLDGYNDERGYNTTAEILTRDIYDYNKYHEKGGTLYLTSNKKMVYVEYFAGIFDSDNFEYSIKKES